MTSNAYMETLTGRQERMLGLIVREYVDFPRTSGVSSKMLVTKCRLDCSAATVREARASPAPACAPALASLGAPRDPAVKFKGVQSKQPRAQSTACPRRGTGRSPDRRRGRTRRRRAAWRQGCGGRSARPPPCRRGRPGSRASRIVRCWLTSLVTGREGRSLLLSGAAFHNAGPR